MERLRPNSVLPFPIFTFLKLNNHIILLKPTDDDLTEGQHRAYVTRGVKEVWIPISEKEAYDRYLNPPKPTVDNRISTVLAAPDIPPVAKKAVIAKAAKKAIADLTAPKSRADQKRADQKARAVVEDVLSKSPAETKALIEDLWTLLDVDPELEHAVTVSTYSVLFALAFGQIDPSVLADVALAALLHDVGLVHVSPDLARIPWKKQSATESQSYENHVAAGAELIRALDPSIPPRVLHLLSQHHEKFDGHGYPNHVEGFHFDDLAQLIAMADTLDTMASGLYDGEKRTLHTAFEHLRAMEKSKSFPEHFNPEIFNRIITWMASDEAATAMKQAEKTTEKKVEESIAS